MKGKPVFHFKPFSKKQRMVLNWWTEKSPVNDRDGIIADGAIRAGKTLCMSLSFVFWAMSNFEYESFAMCGKTVGSFRRNVLFWLKLMLYSRGYKCEDKRSENLVVISKDGIENYFYIFGGKDERSQDLIQGITLAGVFLDEVALMPESFVNQATGRCSIEGSKFWFNCNPEFPSHWFKVNWIDQAAAKNLLYLHFTMDDNLSLSEKVKERYKRMYTGVWYERFILGLWVLAQGLIYPMFQEAIEEPPEDKKPSEYCLSVDYGTMNAFAAILWAKYGTIWWAIREYYYSGRDNGSPKTDEEYAQELDEWLADLYEPDEETGIARFNSYSRLQVIVDPSAASFIALINKRGKYKVLHANNAVLDGIRETATALKTGKIKVSPALKNWKREAEGYVWDEKAGDDKPVKINDHAMDSTRYFVKTKHVCMVKREHSSMLR